MNNLNNESLEKDGFRWWRLDQNNSSGYWHEDDYVAQEVYFQGENWKSIEQEVSDILDNYRDFCECCGERWDEDWIQDSEGTSTPSRYGRPLTDPSLTSDRFCNTIILYYASGVVVKFDLDTKEQTLIRNTWH